MIANRIDTGRLGERCSSIIDLAKHMIKKSSSAKGIYIVQANHLVSIRAHELIHLLEPFGWFDSAKRKILFGSHEIYFITDSEKLMGHISDYFVWEE
jgi:hypothetical protein